jgi:hypothetical protein
VANLTCAILVLICLALILREKIPVGNASFKGHLVARVYERGFVGSDFDQVVIVEQPPWLPFMERTLREQTILDGECFTSTAQLIPTPNGDSVQLICGQRAVEVIDAP